MNSANDITIHGYPDQSQRLSVQGQQIQGQAWHGPICHACNTPYLGRHECDVELVPCPDDKPGCRVAHWRHKP